MHTPIRYLFYILILFITCVGLLKVVKVLVSKKANINITDVDGNTALHLCGLKVSS